MGEDDRAAQRGARRPPRRRRRRGTRRRARRWLEVRRPQRGGELLGVGGAHEHAGAGEQLLARAVGDDPAVADDQQPVGDRLDLAAAGARRAGRCRRGRRSRAAGRASSGCPPGPGRWRARRGSAPRGRRAARARARAAGACRASTGARACGRRSCRGRRGRAARPRARRHAHHLRRDGERLAAAAARMLGRGVEQHADPRGPGCRARGSGRSSTAELPASGSERPTSIRIVVVLPAPLGPRNPVTVPGSQRKETSLTTVRPPRRFVSPVASIMAASIGRGAPREHGLRSTPGSTSVGGRDAARGRTLARR